MAKHKFILLVPLNYNDGSEVDQKVCNQIYDEIFELAGGYYIAGKGQGAYKMQSGGKQVDHCAQVWICVDEEDVLELKAMVARFATLLDQESMYLEFAGSGVAFVEPQAKDTQI